MRTSAQKLFERHLSPVVGRQHVYTAKPRTTVIVETAQWKLSFAELERAKFDATDEHALFIEATSENGVHMVPWEKVLRVTVHQGHSF